MARAMARAMGGRISGEESVNSSSQADLLVAGVSTRAASASRVSGKSLFLVSIRIKRYLCESTVATLYSWAIHGLERHAGRRG